MNALFLVLLLTITPVQWDGHVWNRMSPEAQTSYVGGLMGGLEIGGFLAKNPALPIRGIPIEYIIAELDLYYAFEENESVPIPKAVLLLGKKGAH